MADNENNPRDDKSTSQQRVDAYDKGRQGKQNILGTDNPGEQKAREEGLKDKIDADQSSKEQSERKNSE